MRRVLVSAAEPSGDRLAAEVILALREHGELEARGLCGPALRAAGVEPLGAMEDVAVMGLVEVLRHLPRIRRVRRTMARAIDEGPDLFLGVDAPDFHLPLGAQARKRGVRAVGMVCPQIWAWRPGRVAHIAECWDQLHCLFDFEPPLFAQEALRTGIDVRFMGHPVLDRVPPRGSVDLHRYALLPGSRAQELVRMGPVFLEATRLVREREPSARFALALPPGADDRLLGPLPEGVERVAEVSDLADCRAALSKSGTVTLELAGMGVPMVIAHRVSPLTYLLGRLLVKGVKHIGLPNVLAGREVVPERVQRFTAASLAEDLLALPEVQPVDLRSLGQPGAAARAAAAIAETW